MTYKLLQDKISRFNIDSFNDNYKTQEYIELFSISKLFKELEFDSIKSNNKHTELSVSASEKKPFEKVYSDLCRLHYICLSRKCLNVLEFGSGFSTVVLADAMRILKTNFFEYVNENIRTDNSFHVFSIEEDNHFLEISQSRLNNELSAFATLSKSSVEVILHDNRIATIYSKIPNISPHLIYLDGPSQFVNTKEVNGISFNSKLRMPISADILSFEFFLEPGTLILVDGRTANARFLKCYLRRNWVYRHDPIGDIHYFELQETPLGRFNEAKLNFCLGKKWLLE